MSESNEGYKTEHAGQVTAELRPVLSAVPGCGVRGGGACLYTYLHGLSKVSLVRRRLTVILYLLAYVTLVPGRFASGDALFSKVYQTPKGQATRAQQWAVVELGCK